jgi:hypothetical protein
MSLPGNVSVQWRGIRCFLGLMLVYAVLLTAIPAVPAADGQTAGGEDVMPAEKQASFRDQWGIEIVSLRLSAKDSMLTFRYRVIDPEKAQPLMRRDADPYLVDQATGTKCSNPKMEKVGALRSRSQEAIKGRIYFAIFNNSAKVKTGAKVTVVIGDFKAEDLVVQ